MTKLHILSAAIAALSVASCERPTSVHTPKPVTMKAVKKVIHTSDHRYAYRDDNGIWWWYYYTITTNNNAMAAQAATSFQGRFYTGSLVTGAGGDSSLPLGGSWGRGAVPTTEEMEGAMEEELSLEVIGEGEPAIETTNEGATETDASAEGGASGVDAGGGASAGGDGGGATAGGGGGGGD